MTEQELRKLIEEVRVGKVSRRDFVGTLLGLGSRCRSPASC
jgi:hypothetical protein